MTDSCNSDRIRQKFSMSQKIMTVELILTPIAEKPFEEVYPFQLFQLPSKSEIWVKVSPHYAEYHQSTTFLW
jgi:hypothetical protein